MLSLYRSSFTILTACASLEKSALLYHADSCSSCISKLHLAHLSLHSMLRSSSHSLQPAQQANLGEANTNNLHICSGLTACAVMAYRIMTMPTMPLHKIETPVNIRDASEHTALQTVRKDAW